MWVECAGVDGALQRGNRGIRPPQGEGGGGAPVFCVVEALGFWV